MDALQGELSELENAQLVRRLADEELAYLFKHALTQESAYDSLLVKRRRMVHQRVAEAYEQIYANRVADYAAVLAYHYGEAGDDAKTCEYALQAADAAMQVYAYPEARGHFAQALNSMKRLPDTPELRALQVDAMYQYFEVGWGYLTPEEMQPLVTEAEKLARTLRNADGTLGDPVRLAKIHTRQTGYHFARAEYPETIAYARLGLDEARVKDQTFFMGLNSSQLGLALTVQGKFTEAIPYLTQAIRLLENFQYRWEWYDAVAAHGIALGMGGQLAAGLAESTRAIASTETAQNLFGVAQCRGLRLLLYQELGDLQTLLTECEETIAVARRTEMLFIESLALGIKALASSRLGKHKEAEKTIQASHNVGAQIGGRYLMSDWISAANAEIALNAGDSARAIQLAEQVSAVAGSTESQFVHGWAQRIWGSALAIGAAALWAQVQQHFASSLELFQTGGATLEEAQTHLAWGQAAQAHSEFGSAREHFVKAAAVYRAAELPDALKRTQQLIESLTN